MDSIQWLATIEGAFLDGLAYVGEVRVRRHGAVVAADVDLDLELLDPASWLEIPASGERSSAKGMMEVRCTCSIGDRAFSILLVCMRP